MRKIILCECCGEQIEIDDNEPHLEVCDKCQDFDEDKYGLVDFNEWSED